MQQVKRIEIIIDTPEVPALLAVLRAQGVSGHTIFGSVTGTGDRGERRNDEPTGGSCNTSILTAVPPEKTCALIDAIRPILKRCGGICLVSEASSVVH